MVSRRRVRQLRHQPRHVDVPLALKHLGVEAEVSCLLLSSPAPRAAAPRSPRRFGWYRSPVVARVDRNQLELGEVGLDRRLHVRDTAACRRPRDRRAARLVHLAERGRGRSAPARNSANRSAQSGPSSATMRRRTNGRPSAAHCSAAGRAPAAYSAGSASGIVAISWATFISGPLRPPSASLGRRAWPRRAAGPSSRAPAIRAAWHADGPANLRIAAQREPKVFSLSYLGTPRVGHDGAGMAASSWSISPSSRPSPLAQKPGSDASRPNGASSSRGARCRRPRRSSR